MELRVSEPRTRIIRGLYDIRGGRNWKFLFLLFSIFFRFIYFPRKTRLVRWKRWVATGCVRQGWVGGGGRWRARNIVIDEMRSDCIFHGSGNGSRSKARETRAFHGHVCLPKRISWRARASLPVNLNVFCLLNFDCDYRVHNLKIRMDD